MFWLITLGIVSFLLLLTGSVSVVVKVKQYKQRSEANRAKALNEMMKFDARKREKEPK